MWIWIRLEGVELVKHKSFSFPTQSHQKEMNIFEALVENNLCAFLFCLLIVLDANMYIKDIE